MLIALDGMNGVSDVRHTRFSKVQIERGRRLGLANKDKNIEEGIPNQPLKRLN